MRRSRSSVADILKPAFIPEPASRVFCLRPPEEQQYLVTILLVFNQRLVRQTRALAVNMESVSLQPIVVLRHVVGLFLCDEQPNGFVVLRAKNASVDRGIVDLEFLPQILACVNSILVKMIGALHKTFYPLPTIWPTFFATV